MGDHDNPLAYRLLMHAQPTPACASRKGVRAAFRWCRYEHVHWTSHTSRLNRPELGHPFDSPDYAAEELVAELGAAIGCARLGISPQPRPNHAAYLAHWLKALDADPKALFRSAAAAQRAVDLLETLAGTKTEQTAA